MTNSSDGTGEECNEPLIRAAFGGVVTVRLLCGVTVIICTWALINTTRYSRRLDVVVSLTVGQILLIHTVVAVFSIIGLTLAEMKSHLNDYKRFAAEAIYLWLLIFNWQKHMLYLLLSAINISRTIRYDHVILFSVVSWGCSASPSLSAVLPRYNHGDSCEFDLWRPTYSMLDRLYLMVPTIITLAMTGALWFYEFVGWDRRSRQTYPTCPSCLECRKERRTVKSGQLIRRLVIVFLLTSLPRVVYWLLVYNTSSAMSDYEWLSLSFQGMSGTLNGAIVLYTQWTLVACHVFPCYPSTTAHPLTTDGGDQQLKAEGGGANKGDGDVVAEPVRPSDRSRSRGELLLTARAMWRCQCPHCNDHRSAAETKAAEKVAAHAAAVFATTAASGCSVSRKSSLARSSITGRSRQLSVVQQLQKQQQLPPGPAVLNYPASITPPEFNLKNPEEGDE